MDIFSDKETNLVAPKINEVVNKVIESKPIAMTVSDKISNMISSFYTNYIKNNMFAVFFIVGLIVFLLYRYYNRSGQVEEAKENFSTDEYNVLNSLIQDQTANLRFNDMPTMNPLYSAEQQQQHVYYPPDPLPINIPGSGYMYTRNLYEDPKPFDYLNNPKDYNYNDVYDDKSRSYYNGTYNTYKNAQDTNIVNPLGYPNNFNSTTGDFIGKMTNTNRNALIDYQTVLDNSHDNLVTSLKDGPRYLETDKQQYIMEPPFTN